MERINKIKSVLVVCLLALCGGLIFTGCGSRNDPNANIIVVPDLIFWQENPPTLASNGRWDSQVRVIVTNNGEGDGWWSGFIRVTLYANEQQTQIIHSWVFPAIPMPTAGETRIYQRGTQTDIRPISFSVRIN